MGKTRKYPEGFSIGNGNKKIYGIIHKNIIEWLAEKINRI